MKQASFITIKYTKVPLQGCIIWILKLGDGGVVDKKNKTSRKGLGLLTYYLLTSKETISGQLHIKDLHNKLVDMR